MICRIFSLPFQNKNIDRINMIDKNLIIETNHENPWPRPGIGNKGLIIMISNETIHIIHQIVSRQGRPVNPGAPGEAWSIL
jgi:hypothetical protein